MSCDLVLPERFKNIERVDNLVKGWENVKLAIRPDCRNDICLEKARVALEVDLNDAAINYFWNLTILDLQKKIEKYGIDYFASAINWDGKPLRKIDDLRDVKDYQIIDGAYALGILPDEAQFFLQKCREIRNNFSSAHYPMGDLDRFETMNFIKNCIKYVLTYDLPVPGIQIKDLIERLSRESLNKGEEINYIIESQSGRIHGAILHSLFNRFIDRDCDVILKNNIKLIAPRLWGMVDDEVKSSIASKFVSLKDIQGQDEANEALSFLKMVDGVSFIPQGFLDVIFTKHSRRLLDAHFGVNNFYSEPGYARELKSLGYNVPVSVMQLYVKAVLLSYVGNCYGISHDAQIYNEGMITNLSQTGLRYLFKVISKDVQVIRELSSSLPASRLKNMMGLIKDKTMLPEQKEWYDYINHHEPQIIANAFRERYNKIK